MCRAVVHALSELLMERRWLQGMQTYVQWDDFIYVSMLLLADDDDDVMA